MRPSLLFLTVLLLAVESCSSWGVWGNKEDCEGDNCKNKKKRHNNSVKETDDEPEVEDYFGLSRVSENEHGVPMVHLHDDSTMPLVGLGVEYLQPFLVPLMTASALQRDKKTWLFDTAHVTGNEVLLANGLKQGLERLQLKADESVDLHVITKVWYTHLGYDRTQISIQESHDRLKEAVADYPQVTLKIHMLLQWPRCYETIDWMDCELDEASVGDHVQAAGPPPHQDKENAWKGSWRALEDAYLSEKSPIVSIGVANFHLKDLREMDSMGDDIRVHPHILQVSVWSLLYDPLLVDYCAHKGIHMQIVDAIDGVLADSSRAPNAHHHLLHVAEDLAEGSGIEEVTPTQVVNAWLIQQGVSIIPGPERLSELQENSAVTLGSMPRMTHVQVETVAHCLEAYLSGDDLDEDIHTIVTFTAKSKDAMLYWQHPSGGESKLAFIAKGSSFVETTYPKHHFRVYDARNKDNWVDYHVEAKFGEEVTFDAYLE